MKDVFQVVSTVVIIGLSAITVWLMLKDKKASCSCSRGNGGGKESPGIQPPSCGIAYNRGGKKSILAAVR